MVIYCALGLNPSCKFSLRADSPLRTYQHHPIGIVSGAEAYDLSTRSAPFSRQRSGLVGAYGYAFVGDRFCGMSPLPVRKASFHQTFPFSNTTTLS